MPLAEGIQVAHAVKPTFGFPTPSKPDPRYPDDFRIVAIVEWDARSGVAKNLERAFRLTNNFKRPWRKNPDIAAAGPRSSKHRSSAVGDVFSIPGDRHFRVTSRGWQELV